LQALTEEEKAVLRKRMDTADQVLDRISKHHTSKDEEISHQEYEALLAALTDATAAPPQAAASAELQQAAQELPNMQAALLRSKADTYDTLLVGTAPKALQRIEAVRQQQRERFNADFAQVRLAGLESGRTG
jgi:RPA family protein